MLKNIALLFLLYNLLFVFTPSSTKTIDKPKSSLVNALASPTPIYCPPSLLELDETVVTLPCSNGSNSTPENCTSNAVIRVRTVAVDPENKPLNYKYIVSGGKLIGEGKEVKWDLAGVKPEFYTISVEVDDTKNFHQSYTTAITVKNCEDCKNQK